MADKEIRRPEGPPPGKTAGGQPGYEPLKVSVIETKPPTPLVRPQPSIETRKP